MKSIDRLTLLILAACLLTLGCTDGAVEVAREAADRQAGQNETFARLHEEVAEGTRRLVEEDAAARVQAFQLHRDLLSERMQLSAGWNHLESERQAIASLRHTESWLTAVVDGGGATLAAILALAYAYLTLRGACKSDDTAACDILVAQLVGEPSPLTLTCV